MRTKVLEILNVDSVQIDDSWSDEQQAEKLTASWCRQYILQNIHKAGDGVLKRLDASEFKITILGHRLQHCQPKSTIKVNNNDLIILNDILTSLGSEYLTFNERFANNTNTDSCFVLFKCRTSKGPKSTATKLRFVNPTITTAEPRRLANAGTMVSAFKHTSFTNKQH